MLKNIMKTAPSLAVLLCMNGNAAANEDCYYEIELNKTKLLYLDDAANAIVVGNPNIADISVHSSDTLFVVGRGFGETNLLVLDQDGGIVLDANIIVKAPRDNGHVRLYAGDERESYNCSPYCEASPLLGDGEEFIGSNQYSGINITNPVAAGTATTNGNSAPERSEF